MTRARSGDGDAFRELTEPTDASCRCTVTGCSDRFRTPRMLSKTPSSPPWRGFGDTRDAPATHLALPDRHQPVPRRPTVGPSTSGQAVGRAQHSTSHADPARRMVWLEPYPDALLEGTIDGPPGSEARYEQSEPISLAFVTALQGPTASPTRRSHLARRPRVPSEGGG